MMRKVFIDKFSKMKSLISQSKSRLLKVKERAKKTEMLKKVVKKFKIEIKTTLKDQVSENLIVWLKEKTIWKIDEKQTNACIWGHEESEETWTKQVKEEKAMAEEDLGVEKALKIAIEEIENAIQKTKSQIKNVTDAMTDRKVAEATANVAAEVSAKAEANAVIISLHDLYSKIEASEKNTEGDPCVAVKSWKSLLSLDFFNSEIYPTCALRVDTKRVSMWSVFVQALQITKRDRAVYKLRPNFIQILLKCCLRILSKLKCVIPDLRVLFLKHNNESVELKKILLEDMFDEIKNCIPPFIAGMGNLQRLADDVAKQNQQNKKITPEQLHSCTRCLVNVMKPFASLCFPRKEKEDEAHKRDGTRLRYRP